MSDSSVYLVPSVSFCPCRSMLNVTLRGPVTCLPSWI